MDNQIITQLALIIISIVGALVSAYVIPYIKSKASAEDLEKLMNYAEIAVRCANQIFTPEQWAEKKAYVVNQVKTFMETALKVKFTDEQIDTIIEAFVNIAKQEKEALVGKN